jgi:hypothetical protein
MNSRGSSPLPSHPTSSQVIPVWRGLEGIITNSSHIGVDFRASASIGVELMGFDSRDAHVAPPPSAVEFQLFRSPTITRDLGDPPPPAVHPSSSQFGVGLIPGSSGQQLESSR